MGNVAAVMTELGHIELLERPDPVAGPGQAVVRVHAVGVCGSDVTYYRHGRIGPFVVDGPIVLGHEAAGEVVAVGAGVDRVRVGDRVAIEPGTPCRQCDECLRGRYHLCPDLRFLATPPHDGALVQLLAVDARQLYPLPDSMSYEEGALIEPLSVGLWAARRARLEPGDRVLVTGAGPVGLLAAQAARALGAAAVTLTDVSDFRLDLAARHGFGTERADAEHADTERTDTGRADTGHADEEFDVLLECSGAPGVLASGLGRLANNGRAAVVGIDRSDPKLPLAVLNWKELTIALVNRYQFTWPLGISLVADGRVDLRGLVTHEFGLHATAEALELASRVPDSFKAVVHPQR